MCFRSLVGACLQNQHSTLYFADVVITVYLFFLIGIMETQMKLDVLWQQGL